MSKSPSKEKIAKAAKENPDLSREFIKKILIAQQEAQAGKLEPYLFDGNLVSQSQQ